MAQEKNDDRNDSAALGAGALTQLLAAFACFLGAFVLPMEFPELRGMSRKILVILGCLMLLLGVANIVFGRRLSNLLTRAGRRSRVVIPREGIGYLAIMLTLAIGALLGQRNMPLLVFGMMAGPFILNGWIVYGMLKGITIRRSVPDRVSAGEFVPVEVTAINSKRLISSHLLEVRDQISTTAGGRTLPDTEGIVTFVRVPAAQHRTGRYQVQFAERGKYTLGPTRVSSRFPLGIGERGQILTETSEIIVHPRIGKLVPAWKQHQKELAESSRRVHSRQGLFDDEFHRIREYRTDDNPRSIHWRSTARRGVLMIREYQQNRRADSFVLLDLYDSSEQSSIEFETAISLAATICVDQARSASGSTFLLGLCTGEPVVISSRSPGGFRQEALDALSVCCRSPRADLKSLLELVLSQHDMTDERLLLITPRPQEAAVAIGAASSKLLSDRLDLAAHTTIVPASASAMREAMLFDDDFRTNAVSVNDEPRLASAEAKRSS